MLTVRVDVDKQVIKEMSRLSRIVSLAIGLTGIIGCIPFLVLLIMNTDLVYTILFIVLFVIGAVGMYNFFTILKTNKRAEQANAYYEITFDKNIVLTPFVNGQKKEDAIIEYNKISYYKESEHYIFIHLNRRYAFPVKKDENFPQISEMIAQYNIPKR